MLRLEWFFLEAFSGTALLEWERGTKQFTTEFELCGWVGGSRYRLRDPHSQARAWES